jgi:hypothetical protein
MTKGKIIILGLVIVVALTSASDAQQTRPLGDQLRLSSVMPGGAILYVQASDLSALTRRWLASPIRRAYYASDSFRAFSNSHAYLKLQDRRKDFESALGFGVDETRLNELSGGASAVALYDIGRIDIVFVTEISRPRAIASALFKQQGQFQERSADGASYYVRDVTTDGGRLNQQFCFAYSDGKLVVTTAEGLMVRALANLKSKTDDSMAQQVVKTAESSEGFSSHDVTMWLDQVRLNESRHFRNYWLHHNISELKEIESGLIDLRISGTGITEQRWFKLKPGVRRASELSPAELAALIKFAPTDSQLAEVHGKADSAEDLSRTMSRVLFGELQPVQTQARGSGFSVTSDSASNDGSTSGGARRYGHLDNRFDADVDDPDARGRAARREADNQAQGESDGFEKRISSLISSLDPSGYCFIARSRAEQGKPFVRFDRALVVMLKPDAQIDRAALEGEIANEFRSRFVVSGSESRFGWEQSGGARFIAQSLMEQGAAYAVSGRYLVLASSGAFAVDALNAGTGKGATPAAGDWSVAKFALLRIADAKPMFDTLMTKLDRGTSGLSEGDDQHVSFFSQNLGSLIDALNFRRVEFSERNGNALLREDVTYAW